MAEAFDPEQPSTLIKQISPGHWTVYVMWADKERRPEPLAHADLYCANEQELKILCNFIGRAAVHIPDGAPASPLVLPGTPVNGQILRKLRGGK